MIKIERTGNDEFIVKADTAGLAEIMTGVILVSGNPEHLSTLAEFTRTDVEVMRARQNGG